MKVLISDKISDSCLKVFESYSNLEVLYQPDLGKNPKELKKVIAEVDGLAVRSATQVTAEILEAAKNLKVVGRAGIGVDNIDLEAASKKGVIVMNTPSGNTITTAEHAISMMCALVRNIPQATASLKNGKWEKNKFMGTELYQKTLGVVGCGNIGKIVADRALGLKMNVVGFDPFLSDDIAEELGIKKVNLLELFQQADVISVHTPLNEKTKDLLNKEAFQEMKKGVYILNCARGGIINEDDLAWALSEGIVAGAALDVFVEEPVPADHPLLTFEQVICTPHLGASTEEAQENVAIDVARQIGDFLQTGAVVNALNTASASKETLKHLSPTIDLCEKLGRLQGQLCEESPTQIQIRYYGEILKYPTACLTSAVLQGVLSPMLSELRVNSVNAPYLAKERGIQVEETKINTHSNYSILIEVELVFPNHSTTFSGTLFGKQPRIVKYNAADVEVKPEGCLVILKNQDKPGVVGKIGTCLGDHNVNISNMQLSLDETSGQATAFFSLSDDVSLEVLKKIQEIDGIVEVHKVNL